jgi:hypothetical protein
MPYHKEQELLLPVAKYAKRRGYTLQAFEVPFYDYRIDLYGFSTKASETVAVELKLRKWKRALEQALIYQLCSDFVYIALPSDAAARIDEGLVRKSGIGLIAVGERGCRTLVEAKQSTEVREHYRGPYIDMLSGGGNGRG